MKKGGDFKKRPCRICRRWFMANPRLNPTSCFFMLLMGKSYEFPIVGHVISIGYLRRQQV